MQRGNGFRANKTPFVSGTPLDYIAATTEVLAFGQILKQGSTMGGAVGAGDSTTPGAAVFVGMRATTGATTPIPVLRVFPGMELIVPAASSETAISTTQIGNHVAISSSGTCICAATTGKFVLSGVYSTSAVASQYFTGYFASIAATTN